MGLSCCCCQHPSQGRPGGGAVIPGPWEPQLCSRAQPSLLHWTPLGSQVAKGLQELLFPRAAFAPSPGLAMPHPALGLRVGLSLLPGERRCSVQAVQQ